MEKWLIDLETRLPADRFSLFLRELMTTCRWKGRLFYWMEQEWKAFVARHPSYSDVNPLDAEPVCYLHCTPLHEEEQKIIYGYFDLMFVNTINTQCPLGKTFVIGPDWIGAESVATALVCDQCREIYNLIRPAI